MLLIAPLKVNLEPGTLITAVDGNSFIIMSACVLSVLVRVEQPPLSSDDVGQSPWRLWLHRGGPAPPAEACRDRWKLT